MRKRLLIFLLVSTCLVGCGSRKDVENPIDNQGPTIESETKSESATEADEAVVTELKELTLEEIKKIATTESFDWNTLSDVYEMKYISEENDVSYYSAKLNYNGNTFELYAQVGVAGGDSTGVCLVYLQNDSTSKRLELYSVEKGTGICTEEQIDEFLSRQESLSWYLSINVPEGYKLGTYRTGLEGMFTGCLLYDEGDAEEKISVNYSKRHAGVFIYIDESEVFEFNEAGELAAIKYSALGNNFEIKGDLEAIEILDGCQALIGNSVIEDYIHDTDEYESTEFWHIFIDSEYDANCYMLYFNVNDFTKEEAINIAKSIEFAEK